MIPDGFGPTSETFSRGVFQYQFNISTENTIFPLDSILVGTSRTKPASLHPAASTTRPRGYPITDSAAGATAFACGIKTYNEAIAGKRWARGCVMGGWMGVCM